MCFMSYTTNIASRDDCQSGLSWMTAGTPRQGCRTLLCDAGRIDHRMPARKLRQGCRIFFSDAVRTDPNRVQSPTRGMESAA